MEENYWTRLQRRRFGRRGLLSGAAAGTGLAAFAVVGCSSSNNNNSGSTASTQAVASRPAGTSALTTGGAAPSSGGAATAQARATQAAKPKTPADLSFVVDARDPTVLPVKTGGTLHIFQSITIPSVDPRKNASLDAAWYHGMCSSTLLAHDGSPAVGMFEDPIVGDIANKWEQPDDKTYIFHIDPTAKWQNRPPANGRAVTAADVQYSLDLWRAPSQTSFTTSRFLGVDHFETPDPATVRMIMSKPTAEILDQVGYEFHPIVNKEYVESVGGDIKDGGPNYVGSGPFWVTDWQPRQQVTFDKNPAYWGLDKQGNKLPYLDKVQYLWITDPAAQQAAFQAGQLDQVSVPIEQFDQYNARNDVKMGKTATASGQVMLFLNLRKSPMQDQRVRQAISMAIDRKALDDQVFGGIADRATPFPPAATGDKSLPGWDALPATYQHNVAQAKQLLSAAGMANGVDLGPITYWEISPAHVNGMLLYQQQLKAAGITVNPNKQDRTAILQARTDGSWDGIIYNTIGTPGATNQSWADWMRSDNALNYWGIKDPAVDTLVDQLRTTLDNTQRAKLFQQLQKLEYDNCYRLWSNQLGGISASKNYVMNAPGNAYISYKVYMNKYVWLNK